MDDKLPAGGVFLSNKTTDRAIMHETPTKTKHDRDRSLEDLREEFSTFNKN
jgi:hypothetical protein